jgi:probable rRNA maturation factor
MILFDGEQVEAAEGFAALRATVVGRRAALPVRATLQRFLLLAQAAVKLRGEVTVLLTTDTGIRSLNRRFRGKNKSTDVLSFPVEDRSYGEAGDLAISVETASRQAAEHGHSLGTEMKVLMLHGLLHLAGHDHEADRGEMAKLEAKLRARLKLKQGLIERVEGAPAKRVVKAAGKAKGGRR